MDSLLKCAKKKVLFFLQIRFIILNNKNYRLYLKKFMIIHSFRPYNRYEK